MKTIETDVVVVAAGLSGLAATVSAAEGGARVIALEKAKTTGGAANMGMGPLGVGSRMQRHRMVTLTPGEAFRKHMNFVHWRVDARLVRDYYWKSGNTIDWLEDMGVQFFGVSRAYAAPENVRYYAGSEETGHLVMPAGGGLPGPGSAASMIKVLTDRAKTLGADIQLETAAKKIFKEAGKVAGVIAEGPSGEQIQIRAKAVIIATGGFGDNPEWIKKLTGYEWGKDLFSFRIPGCTGDGLKMAWEAGAAKTDVNMELMYVIPDNMSYFSLDGAFRQPCLWVNTRGQRFMNEDGIPNTTYTGNAIAAQPKRCAFSIIDGALLNHYKKNGADIQSHIHPFDMYDRFDQEVQQAIDAGYQHLFIADSLEELAKKAGIDAENLVHTVEEYNGLCAKGHDDLFEKEYRYLYPIKEPKFYAIRYFPGAYGTLGGIKINHKTEVMNADDQVITGLYAVGTDACSIFGDSYPFILGGNTMGFALNSGRIAGENAAKLAKA